MVIVRRDGFANDHWPLAGSSLLTVHYPAAGWFQGDPSHMVRDAGCRHEGVADPSGACAPSRATRSTICG